MPRPRAARDRRRPSAGPAPRTRCRGAQPSSFARLRGVGDQVVDLGRAQERRVELDVALAVEPDVREGDVDQVLGPSGSRRCRSRSRAARPAAASATSPRRTRAHSPSRAARRGCRASSSSARPSLIAAAPWVTLRVTNSRPAARALVVEEDPRAGEEAVALAVVDGDEVPVGLRDAVRAARVERRALRSAAPRAPCRTSRSTTPGRSGPRGSLAHRLEHARDADAGELGGQRRLDPGRGDERHRGEVVDLVGLARRASRRDQRALVEQVAGVELDPVADRGSGAGSSRWRRGGRGRGPRSPSRAATRPGSCRPVR